MSPTNSYRLAWAVAVAALLLLVLSAGALGIIAEGGRADRGYVAVPAVAVVGTLVARLRASGMALALLATAVTMALVTAIAFAVGLPQDENASTIDVVGVTALFVVLFGLSGWLFRRAADQDLTVAAAGRR